jgi:penicillin-binding protein 1A
LDYSFNEMKKLVDTQAFRHISDRAFVVRTAIDLGLQRASEEAVESMIRQFGRDYHANEAAVGLADLDGAVRAMVGELDYNASQLRRDGCLSPAGLLIQAICVRHCTDKRLQAHLGRR